LPNDVLPVIAEGDYAAFQNLIVEMPIGWADWLAKSQQEERWRLLEGLSMQKIRISPAEFKAWFHPRHKRKAKPYDLLLCAIAFACQPPQRPGDDDPLDDDSPDHDHLAATAH
jgi:hypothetical protein